MDEKKFCFIICLRNQVNRAKIMQYLNKLQIPRGYTAEVSLIDHEVSIAKAYQQAMLSSDAKYKIYVSENICIQQEFFLAELLQGFAQGKNIGMIGVSGTEVIPANGVLLTSHRRIGRLYNTALNEDFIWGEFSENVKLVQAVDGWLMATQVDIPWRDDLFTGACGYDLAQNIELQKAGYACAVIKQVQPWCSIETKNFDFSKRDTAIFLKEYGKDLFPLVTVLIPTYNRPEYLKIALESVLAQNYWNLEIIISDNSTNDLSEQMLQPYLASDSRIKYFSNKGKGFGLAENWNWLMEYPSAEYINWLMDDDFFYPDKISTMMTYYLENDTISLVTSASNLVDEQGKFIKTRCQCADTKIISGHEFGREILRNVANCAGEPTTALLKKKALLKGKLGWRDWQSTQYAYSPIIDIETWLQVSMQGDVVYIAEPLSAFRSHDGQDQKNMDTIIEAWIHWYDLIEYAYEKKVFLLNECDRAKALQNYQIDVKKVVEKCQAIGYKEHNLDKLIKYLALASAQRTSPIAIKAQRNERIKIIVATCNDRATIEFCLECIKRYTPQDWYDLIVVDLASQDGTREWLRGQQNIKLICHANENWAEGYNLGLAEAGKNTVFLMDGKTFVTYGWLEILRDSLRKADAFCGAITVNWHFCQTVNEARTKIDLMAQKLEPIRQEQKQILFATIFGMLITSEVIETIGKMDENLSDYFLASEDYCLRLLQHNYKVMVKLELKMISTILPENILRTTPKNSIAMSEFKEKWGFSATYSTGCNYGLLSLLNLNKQDLAVLDVGCACGRSLLEIQSLNTKARLYGIELCDGAAEIAKHFGNVYKGNIEKFDFSTFVEKFDYIIFADVLEHLHEPWNILAEMRNLLNPNGRVVVSIPNIMHFSVLCDLLSGHWDYAMAGILDITHLRFFTKKSICHMFDVAGYEIINIRKTTCDSGDVEFMDKLRKSGLLAEDCYNDIDAYQFLVEAKLK